MFYSKSIKMSKNFNYFKYYYYNIFKQNNNSKFYDFFLFIKVSYIKNKLVKIFLLNKLMYNFSKYYNNNKILNTTIGNKKIMETNLFFSKISKFLSYIQIKQIIIKKEGKNYNFFFYNLMNSNLFNFYFLY